MSNEITVIDRPSVPALASDLLAAVLAGRKATTMRSYRADYRAFAAFCRAPSPASALERIVSLTQGEANALALGWKAEMADRGLATATIARRLAALRTAVKIARMLGRVAWTLEVEPPRVEAYRDTSGCGLDGWRKLLALAQTEAAAGSAAGARNLAIVRLLHDLGLRRGEAAGLDVADVDTEGSKAWVLGKGRTARVALTMPAPTRAAVVAWLAIRGTEPGPLLTRLDPARGGRPSRLSGESVNEIVKGLGRRAGLSRPIRAHGLRHEAVSQALDKTRGDVRAVAKFSRHKNLNVLTVYDDRRVDAAGTIAGLVADDE